MSKILSVFCAKLNGANSFADTLNFRITVCLLSTLAVLTMVRVLISEPIRCFTASQLTTKQSEHAEQLCWMANRHYVEDSETTNVGPMKVVQSYHQWIPVVFALQALLFYTPNLFWKLGSSHSGTVNIRHIESAAAQLGSNPETAAQAVNYMAKCLGQQLRELERRWRLTSMTGRTWLLVTSNYTTWLYVGVKLLYIVNIIGQFVLLDAFLGDGEMFYGISALKKLRHPQEHGLWTTSKMLPITFYCDFSVRSLGSVHRHSTQCSLPMNLWYEIIFLFLFFWFIFVAVITICSLSMFVLSQLNVFHQKRYCCLRLIAMGKANESQNAQISRFVNDFLTRDVWFIVQQVGRISGDHIATQLICGLWDFYVNHKQGDDIAAIPSSAPAPKMDPQY